MRTIARGYSSSKRERTGARPDLSSCWKGGYEPVDTDRINGPSIVESIFSWPWRIWERSGPQFY